MAASSQGPSSVSAVLLRSLENLAREDLRRFQFHLLQFNYGNTDPIPRGRLENADPTQTARLIVECYGEDHALDVTIQVLNSTCLRGPVEDLQREQRTLCSGAMKLEETPEEFRNRYKVSIQKEFQRMKDRNARPGESVNLNQRYTRLCMTMQHRDEEERRRELMTYSTRDPDILNRTSWNNSLTTIEALFDPGEDGFIPQTVVLQGPAGIGKTTTSQKIMLDWASGNLYQDKFNYSFYISCREINRITGNLSIAALISKICRLKCPPPLMREILEQSETILLVIDGLDELKFSLEDGAETEVEDPFQEAPVGILLNSLLRKQVLVNSSVIITTRPITLKKLSERLKPLQYVEIMGFTGKNREEYFCNFFGNEEEAARVLNLIKGNPTLFTLCALPITCWIVCTVLKQTIQTGLDVNIYNTSTSIYVLYLKSLIKYHSRNSKLPVITCLKRVSSLAKEGVWEQKVIFQEEDLRKHGLTVSDIESTFLNENIFQRDIETQTCYSFVHLSVQEFFAALYYVLSAGGESGGNSEDPNRYGEIRTLLEKVNECPHLSVTVRFLFGLSGEKQMKKITEIIPSKMTCGYKSVLEESINNMRSSKTDRDIVSYLYETQDEKIVKTSMSHFTQLEFSSYFALQKCDPKHLSYCLIRSENVQFVFMYGTSFSREDVKILSPGLHKCSSVRFMGCRFPDERFDFSDPGSKVQDLELVSCDLTSSCCEDLLSVITTNRSLIKLDLKYNNLLDSGVKRLCEGLRHPRCVLQELRLVCCDLTSSCCEDLLSVIVTNRSLVKLDLSQNKLQDSGVKRLCEGLRHPDCVLKELSLQQCRLTSSSCEDLFSVIITNRSLMTLDLTQNKLQNSGVKRLCEGLRHPDCVLQELRLDGETINVAEYRTVNGLLPATNLQNLSVSGPNCSSADQETIRRKREGGGQHESACLLY